MTVINDRLPRTVDEWRDLPQITSASPAISTRGYYRLAGMLMLARGGVARGFTSGATQNNLSNGRGVLFYMHISFGDGSRLVRQDGTPREFAVSINSASLANRAEKSFEEMLLQFNGVAVKGEVGVHYSGPARNSWVINYLDFPGAPNHFSVVISQGKILDFVGLNSDGRGLINTD